MSESSTVTAQAVRRIRAMSRPAHFKASQARGVYSELFFISFAILFLELACIRWFGSTVIFLTFFTNLVLMACFLGMSVGLLAARDGSRISSRWVIPLAVVAVGNGGADSLGLYPLGEAVHRRRRPGARRSRSSSAPRLRQGDLSKFVMPIEVIAGAFFAVIALMFVGLGQAMGRAFDGGVRSRGRLTRSMSSAAWPGSPRSAWPRIFQTPPVVWFAVGRGGSSSSAWASPGCRSMACSLSMVLLATAATRGRRSVPDLLVAILQDRISPAEPA